MRLFPLAPVPAAAAATLLPLLPLPAFAASAIPAAAPAAHVLTAPAHTAPAPAVPAYAAPAYAAPAYAAPAPDPACAADTGSSGFPLRARIRGGPAVYDAGGGYGVWYLDLTNTTHGTCTAVHPVVVLVDERRALTAAQPRLEFDDGARTRSVRFETTDEDELVGAFGETDGFGGFSVGPRRTLTVRVRLAFTADAVPNEVTAEAAVVRRHDDDGDWVGQSNDYRFAVHNPSGPAPQRDPATDPGATPPGPARTSATAGPTPDPTPAPTPAPTGALATDELARTGIADGALAAAVALLLGGAALLVLRRRR